LGKPVLIIILIVNFQGEKREIVSWQRGAGRLGDAEKRRDGD